MKITFFATVDVENGEINYAQQKILTEKST